MRRDTESLPLVSVRLQTDKLHLNEAGGGGGGSTAARESLGGLRRRQSPGEPSGARAGAAGLLAKSGWGTWGLLSAGFFMTA